MFKRTEIENMMCNLYIDIICHRCLRKIHGFGCSTLFSFWFEFMHLRDANATLFTELTIQNVCVCVCAMQCSVVVYYTEYCWLHFHIYCFVACTFIAFWIVGLLFLHVPEPKIFMVKCLYDTPNHWISCNEQFPRNCS